MGFSVSNTVLVGRERVLPWLGRITGVVLTLAVFFADSPTRWIALGLIVLIGIIGGYRLAMRYKPLLGL